MSGRSILDGPLVLNEVISCLKKSSKRGLLFKADINKDFNSLSWEFLDKILGQMLFPNKWRRWIRAILSCSKVSVLVNGSPTSEFSCSRGLKQGDPLSPLPFILAIEALSSFTHKACELGLFKGIRCSESGILLSHFIFANDVLFVGEWSLSNLLNLKQIMRCFFLISGLGVNSSKCSLYGVGVNDEDVGTLASYVNCKAGKMPFKHLGLQIGANMNLSSFDGYRVSGSNKKKFSLGF
ncbi:hypothetical protein SSX86_008117 [Deinandra increscens subsp. villosa]|uniref:Reverse transcriptase domain-containing protein n=1 Tax=Deinandra increscens subsp. villosa TaxID=3103831 RepID=A0AAP0DEW1_9ASTR